MNVHKLADRKVRPVRSRAAGRDAGLDRRSETLGLDLVDLMLDLDPGMLVWPAAQSRDSSSLRP